MFLLYLPFVLFFKNKILKLKIEKMCMDTILSYRQYCLNSQPLPTELHLKLYDITNQTGKTFFIHNRNAPMILNK